MALLTGLCPAGPARASDEAPIPEAAGEAARPEQAADSPTAPGPAATADPKASPTEIDKVLTDPVSETWFVSLVQNHFRITRGNGAADRWNSRLQFQGAVPVSLTAGFDLVTRPSIEFFNSQPHPRPGNPTEVDRTTALGDIVLLQLLVPRREWIGGWILGVGLAFARGSGPSDIHAMSFQPVVGCFLRNGWSIGYSGNTLATTLQRRGVETYAARPCSRSACSG